MDRSSCVTVNACRFSPAVSCFGLATHPEAMCAGRGGLKLGSIDGLDTEESYRAQPRVRNRAMPPHSRAGSRSYLLELMVYS